MNALSYSKSSSVKAMRYVSGLPSQPDIDRVFHPLDRTFLECCSQERSYSTFYGLVGKHFSKLNCIWMECLKQVLGSYYHTIHRYETSRLRNISRVLV
ncbi:hypothetical protein JVT61DRAFT_10728 [Boletus reticuloceps]|uniref:MI domain-containing protein n=1 Tax=Boletus reticuloceps TaxID=495285 RepID=A0A8I2YGD6_9AGAM|nr:hypothetical protein JVT61DRAFT_10728 [Boletus reticuloceps]